MAPAVHEPRPAPYSPPAPQVEERRPPGILVADDDPAVRQILSWFLRQAGCAVWCAENGLDAVRTYFGYQQCIDLVLLDIDMPLLDGCHAARVLRRLNPLVRFCFMSGDLERHLTEELLDLGPLWSFPKPFPVARVVELLQQLIRADRGRGA